MDGHDDHTVPVLLPLHTFLYLLLFYTCSSTHSFSLSCRYLTLRRVSLPIMQNCSLNLPNRCDPF